ncbi:MAG: hypothetical protein ABJA94_00325 [Rhodoglobus sp.]
MKIRSRMPGLAIVVAALATAVPATAGGSLIPVWTVVLVAASVQFSRKLPVSLSISLATVGFLALELILLRITPYLGWGISLPNIIVWTAISIGFGALETVRPMAATLFTWRRSWLGLAASASAIALIAVLSLAQLLRGSASLYWSTNNDAVIGLRFARLMVSEGGLGINMGRQSTPLPFAMAAANMDSGRAGLSDSLMQEHDLVRIAQVWVFLIAIGCILAGVTVARRLTAASQGWAIPVVALASSSMLAWFVIGVQFDFGFMNSAFAIAALLAAWLIFDSAANHPLVAIAGLFTAALVALGVWSPLIVCVIGLGVAVLVTGARAIRRARRGGLVAAAVTGVVLLAYAVGVTLPQLFDAPTALGNNGGFPPIGPGSMLIITSLTVLAAALALRGETLRTGTGVAALVATFLAGLAYLLAQRRGVDFIWGYYPAKFAWTVSVLLIVIIMSLAVHLIASASLTRSRRAIVTIAVGAVIASLLFGPVAVPNQAPLISILKTAVLGSPAPEQQEQPAESRGLRPAIAETIR